jgi:two-component SAPR family response regulator
MLPSLFITCFGRFEIRQFGQVVALCHNRSGQTILRYLVAQPGYCASVDSLMDALWPEDSPQVARRKLQIAVSALRRSLNSDYSSDPGGGYVLCKDQFYLLNPAAEIRTDVDEFLSLWQAAKQASGSEILHLYERRERERQSEFEREEEERQFKYEVGKRERQRDFEREEDARQHMFDLHYQLRVAAAQELKEILRERIRDAYDRGKSIDGVAEESLKLLTAFHESLHRGYVFSTSSNGSSTSANGTSPDAHTISSDEDTTIEDGPTTDPVKVPPDMSDLSSTKQKEADKE